MRTLLAIILMAAFGWGGYWMVGSSALEKSVAAWFEMRRAEGWQAEYAKLEVEGFPNRFDTTVTGLVLADPHTGWAWTMPFFQVFALSYNLRHVIAVWPHAHTFATPLQSVELKSEDMRGSVAFTSVTTLGLDHAEFVVRAPDFTSTDGWTLAADALRLAAKQEPEVPNGYRIGLAADALAPGGAFKVITAGLELPPTLQDFQLDATVGFSKPWDRTALEVARPQPRSVDLRIARAEWGDILFQAAGKLDVDDDGEPSGEIALQIRNWPAVLDMLKTAHALPEELLPSIEGGLELLAGVSGNPNYIDVTLSLRAGFISVGIVPIGMAPRLSLR